MVSTSFSYKLLTFQVLFPQLFQAKIFCILGKIPQQENGLTNYPVKVGTMHN